VLALNRQGEIVRDTGCLEHLNPGGDSSVRCFWGVLCQLSIANNGLRAPSRSRCGILEYSFRTA
jgi:hypothetical protein